MTAAAGGWTVATARSHVALCEDISDTSQKRFPLSRAPAPAVTVPGYSPGRCARDEVKARTSTARLRPRADEVVRTATRHSCDVTALASRIEDHCQEALAWQSVWRRCSSPLGRARVIAAQVHGAVVPSTPPPLSFPSLPSPLLPPHTLTSLLEVELPLASPLTQPSLAAPPSQGTSSPLAP